MLDKTKLYLEDILKNIPAKSGVYIFKGIKKKNVENEGTKKEELEILYIGKAKTLKTRVRSYFRDEGDGRLNVKFFQKKITNIDYIVTSNEKEALILEDTLLKKHKPKYNIRLKDDKTYVHIKFTLNEDFPRISVTRDLVKDGSRYFGPYQSAKSVRETIKFLRRIFPLCVCSSFEFKTRKKPCLDLQLGLCPSPATGNISQEDYNEYVQNAVKFLNGKNLTLVKDLKSKMAIDAQNENFEEASKVRDRIFAIEEMLTVQQVVTQKEIDRDVFGYYREDKKLVIVILMVRDGRLVASRDFHFNNNVVTIEEALSSFIRQFYYGDRFIAKEVILPVKLKDREFLEEYLSEKKDAKVKVLEPKIGDMKKLVFMANDNAMHSFNKEKDKKTDIEILLLKLQKRLRLKNIPNLIEGYDISNISGKHSVGSKVCFKKGKKYKDGYRRFKIKSKDEPDDYAMMEEILRRRFSLKDNDKLEEKPDLIVIDGGKGHLNVALSVLQSLKIKDIDVISISKEKTEKDGVKRTVRGRGIIKNENIFLRNVKDPIIFSGRGKEENIILQVRDESHRFALGYHRKVRSKSYASILDKINGIGPKKRAELYKEFNDLEGMKKAGVKGLQTVKGITKEIAESIMLEIEKNNV